LLAIKTATEADLPLIHELGRQCFYPTYLPFISKEQVDYMFHRMYDLSALQQQITEKGHVFLLAIQQDEAVGFASCEPDFDGMSGCKVHKLYVLPGIQAKGVGRALLDRVALDARATGQRSIWLNVNRYNKAVNFYKHLGFDIVAEEDIDIGNGFYMNDYEMKKALDV
jgi:diamine N-acetyltransferase